MKLVVKNYADPIKMFLTLPVELWDIIIEYYLIYHINHILTISYNINDYEIFNSKQYKYNLSCDKENVITISLETHYS